MMKWTMMIIGDAIAVNYAGAVLGQEERISEQLNSTFSEAQPALMGSLSLI